MAPNLRKPTPNLSKPSEGNSFDAKKKPSESTNPLGSLSISAQRELGTVGGIKSTAKLTVGVDDLIGQQGLDIEIDTSNRTVGFGAGIGSTKGKLGVNIGGRVGYDEEGNVSIKGAEAAINIGGFGGSASIDEDEGIKGSISIAGGKIEIGIAPDGKKTLSLCYGVPGGELCVIFEPQEYGKPPLTLPGNSPGNKGIGWGADDMPPLDENCIYRFKMLILSDRYLYTGYLGENYQSSLWEKVERLPPGGRTVLTGFAPDGNGVMVSGTGKLQPPPDDRPVNENCAFVEENIPEYRMIEYFGISGVDCTPQQFREYQPQNWFQGIPPGNVFFILRKLSCYGIPQPFEQPEPPNNGGSPPPDINLELPNYPQHFKRMNCCEEVKEIYKYLGIGKLKRNKFAVSNVFLVPGGKGNDMCVDYYSIMQALFRMLANGLIINPKSKPLGSEWQNVNATAWASGMYEMMAESMSDGNTTQRFEVAAIMQLVQIMATLAENGRKIEFVADAIGIEPLPVPENVPVCFTIYEGHKGFGKKEPKKINVSGLKTDDDVENVLGKMLNPSLIPITSWKFKPGQISINEALRNG